MNDLISNASNFAKDTDIQLVIMLGVTIFFTVLFALLLVVFTLKYRKSKHPKAQQIHGSTTLEVVWTIIPLVFVLVMFYYTWKSWESMYDIPEEGIEINVEGKMWSWNFEYSNGVNTDTLYVPVNENVILDLYSPDVLHSLFIPAFRVKQDMVPDRHVKMWFRPQSEGVFNLFCAEYCGIEHYNMITKVKVVSKATYQEWLSKAENATQAMQNDPVALGAAVLKQNGCTACHSLDGTQRPGPTFKGILGSKRVVIGENGEEITRTMDVNYLRESIKEPNKEVSKGFQKLMQPYPNITDQEIESIAKYLETIK